MRPGRIVIVGAGIAGLAAALSLTARGHAVTVCEQAPRPGGKIRSCRRPDIQLDVGPTVFTMPWVFDELLSRAGTSLDALLDLEKLEVLAHHRWQDGSELDLFADPQRSAAAIRTFSSDRSADEYLRFCEQARTIYETLLHTFMTRPQPGLTGLLRNAGPARLAELAAIRPFQSLWRSLSGSFHDSRLRQLFARYATYQGSSPFHAPATMMLIAHVEQLGVWRIRGGMRALASALADTASGLGAEFRYDTRVMRIGLRKGRPQTVELASGERLQANSVIVNADVNAIASGKFGSAVQSAVPAIPIKARSLSAITWAGEAVCSAPLSQHNVIFSNDYKKEFQALGRRMLPEEPTVYLHAPDQGQMPATSRREPQRLFVLINAPPCGDTVVIDSERLARAQNAVETVSQRCGIDLTLGDFETTTPGDFERRFPATGGALYGRATHGWRAAFARSGNRTRIRGLYVAGGSVHPGAGVPMAALSGSMAATCLIDDLDASQTQSGQRGE